MIKKAIFNYLAEIFSLDLRSLALFRILVACIIIIDLLLRATDIIAHYSDDGVLPRAAAIAANGSYRWSLHFVSGLWQVQFFLFIIAGIFALLLLIGYKTRAATIISWIFLLSIQNRNIWVNSAGDQLLHLIVFWGIFLPLGAKYSIDSLWYNTKKIPTRITSIASVGYTLQIFFIYFFTAIFKFDPGWTTQATAVYYVLHLYSFATPFGQFLKDYFSWSFTTVTRIVYGIEAVGFYFLFSPYKRGLIRTIAIFVFMGMHIGFGLGLALGIFSPVVIIAFTALFPSFFWESIQKIVHYNKQQKLTIYYDDDCGFCKQIVLFLKTFLLLSNTNLIPAHNNKSLEKDMKEYNSWILVDETGKKFYKFDAIIPLSKASPLLFIFAPILSSSFIRNLGKHLYNFIAARRKSICPINRNEVLLSLPKTVQLPKYELIFLIFCLLYMIYYNIYTIAPSKIPQILIANRVGFFLSIQQQWNMFSPHPPQSNGWFVVPGKLKNGKLVDLHFYGQPVNWNPPLGTRKAENARWTKYFSNLAVTKNFDYKNYMTYLCRKWNNSHTKPDEKINELSMYYLYQKTGINEKQEKIHKYHVLDWYCMIQPKTSKVKK